MKKLFSWTATDAKNETLEAPPARLSDKHLDADHGRLLRTPRRQRRSVDFQSAVSRIFNPQRVQTIQDVPRLETCDTVPQLREKSTLRAVAPAAYADFLVQRLLPRRRHRIPIIFLGPLPQEEEEPVQIQVGSIKVSAETFHQ
jgi:hypothetical protein